MTPELEVLLEPLRASIGQTGIFLDFDGTLAPIVVDPATSRPLPGVSDAVSKLAERAGVVAVISGRPGGFLLDKLQVSPKVALHGLYGLQTVVDGQVHESAEATRWREIVDLGATNAESHLPKGVHVERKGVSFVLHYRRDLSLETIAEEWAASFAARSGLDAHRGRLSIEIGPLSSTDKGRSVTRLSQGLRYACAVGDDAGDLPMFEAVKTALGGSALNLVVNSTEVPERLRKASDATVGGPDEVLEVVRYLAG